MGEETAVGVGPSGIDVAYERFGDAADPPVLLVMGGGAQMINWPEGLCAELADRGLYVIRFDNRDAGRSTHFSDLPEPDLRAALTGDLSTVPYTLSDMAADTVGLLDVDGIARCACRRRVPGRDGRADDGDRVRRPDSVVDVDDVEHGRSGRRSGRLRRAGRAGAAPEDRQGHIDWTIRASRVLGSPGFVFDEAAVAERAGRAYDRGHDRSAMLRQAVATVASGDRTARLGSVRVPILVIHGTADIMCDVSGGRATAAAVPGAELVVIDGMGHNFPRELWPRFGALIANLVQHVERNPS